MRRQLRPAALVGVVVSLLIVLVGSAGARSNATPPGKPTASKVLFFSSDGMRPDLMESYAAAGVMPTYKSLMDAGGRRASREEGGPGRLGRRPAVRDRRADRRLRELLLDARRADEAGRTGRAGRRRGVRHLIPGRELHARERLEERPGR